MTTTSERDARVQRESHRILDTGLRNLWYPIVPSWQVGNAPIGITRLGERIVLWRDAEGKVHALEDRCPHRPRPHVKHRSHRDFRSTEVRGSLSCGRWWKHHRNRNPERSLPKLCNFGNRNSEHRLPFRSVV